MPETQITDEEVIARMEADFEGTPEMDEKSILIGSGTLTPAELISQMRAKTALGLDFLNLMREEMGADLAREKDAEQ